jgi:mannosyltransferase PIG-V
MAAPSRRTRRVRIRNTTNSRMLQAPMNSESTVAPLTPRASVMEGVARALRPSFVALLELILAGYTLALLTIVMIGGIDLGVFHLSEAAKPILVLLVALPLRLTIGGRSWLVERARASKAFSSGALPAIRWPRVPSAVVDAAFAFVVTRVASVSVGFIGNLLLGSPSASRPFPMPFRNAKFAQIFAAWDSGWYFDIASRGYYFDPNGQSSVAFFPLYPMLMRAVAWPFGGSERAIWLAGIAVSYTAFALALVEVHRLAERLTGDRQSARRAVLYLAIFPFSFFFTRVYAESVFLLTSVLAVSRAYSGRWWQAGIWGALATLARPNGILVALPLAVLALADRPAVGVLGRRLAALALVPAGFAAYCGFVYTLSGDPLAWLSAQAHWGYSLGHPPWQQLLKMIARVVKFGLYDYFFVSDMAPYRLFHGVIALMFLALTPAVFKRFGAGLGLYVLVSMIVPLSGNALEGVGRYAAVLFPVFMVVGSFKSPRLHEAILVVGALFLSLFVCLFATGRPIY